MKLGDRALGAPALAMAPLDHWVAVEGGRKTDQAKMVTRAFGFTGRELVVNVAAHLADAPEWHAGDIRIEVQNGCHDPIPGFTLEDADPIRKSHPAHVATWKGKADLSALAGRTVRLRFVITLGRMYSFQFRP